MTRRRIDDGAPRDGRGRRKRQCVACRDWKSADGFARVGGGGRTRHCRWCLRVSGSPWAARERAAVARAARAAPAGGPVGTEAVTSVDELARRIEAARSLKAAACGRPLSDAEIDAACGR